MFGAYQAGAWKALRRIFSPDIVVGASVGSLNGWLIAGGVTGEELIERWLDPSAGDLMAYRARYSRWKSVFHPGPLEAGAKLLVSHYKPRVDFGVALLQLPWLRRKLVRNGEVTWRHLVASCSVPGGFPPVRIDNALYCDGGLLEATPIWAAVEMGATHVIAVNASRFVPPRAVGLMIKGIQRARPSAAPAPEGLKLTLITPQDYLGRMFDGAAWRRESIERWIELGEADAAAAIASGTFCLYNVS